MSGRTFFYAEDQTLTSGSTTFNQKVHVDITQAQGGFVSDTEEWIVLHSVMLSNDGIGRGTNDVDSNNSGAQFNSIQFFPKDSTDFMACVGVTIVSPEFNLLDALEIDLGLYVGIETDS